MSYIHIRRGFLFFLSLTILILGSCNSSNNSDSATSQDTTGNADTATSSGGFVLVTEMEGNTVAKIDTDTNQITERVTVGASPQFIVADDTRRLAYVSVFDDDKIAAIKVDTMETADVAISRLGKQPIGVTLTQDGQKLLVATRGSDGIISNDDRLDIVTLNPDIWPPTASLSASVYTGKHPIVAIVDHTGRYAVVTVRNEPAILVIDLSTYNIVWQASDLPSDAEPEGGDAHPTENIVYVSLHGPESTIEVIDLDLMAITQHVPIQNSTGLPAQPSTVRFTPDGSRLYVSGQVINKLLLFDTRDPRNPVQDSTVELSTGPQPHFIAWFPDGRAYVANTNNEQPYGSISVIENYSEAPSISEELLTDLAGPLSFVYFSNI